MMTHSFPSYLADQFYQAGVIAVVVIDRKEDAIPLMEVLMEAGIRVVELALRTPAALPALKEIRSLLPELLVGAGTVVTPELVERSLDAGALFGVSPGFNPRVVSAAMTAELPFAPGVLTPSDIELAVEAGCRLLKLFPAEPMGGLSYLRVLNSPFAHLLLKFIPLGGLSEDHLTSYLAEPSVCALGGSWIAPRELIGNRDWVEIRKRARAAVQRVAEGRCKMEPKR